MPIPVILMVKALWQILCVLSCGWHSVNTFVERHVVSDTAYGQVRGIARQIYPGYTVHAFVGIPYATPPVGKLRFEPPEPPSPWRPSVLNATQLPPACLQISHDLIYLHMHRPGFEKTGEDCLYLNIYVPQTSSIKLPVFFFIHGGSNMAGMGAFFDGDILAVVGKMIVVTINYRLGGLGFLGTGDPDFPGNYGLLDQVLSLRWVKNNIAYFGGDPELVTIIGHSAGAFNAGIHLFAPHAKGLFKRVICLSGSLMSTVAVRMPSIDPKDAVKDLSCHINCRAETPLEMKQCFKNSTSSLMMHDWQFLPGYRFPAIVDGMYITGQPDHMIRHGFANGQAILSGVTKDEGVDFAAKTQNYDGLEKFMRKYYLLPENRDLYKLVQHEYTSWDNPHNKSQTGAMFNQAITDALFNAPMLRTFDAILEHHNVTLYMYRFEYVSQLQPFRIGHGVPHGADLFYIFGVPFVGHPHYIYYDNDREMSRIYIEFFSSFVRNGVPRIHKTSSSQHETELPQYTAHSKKYTSFRTRNGHPAVVTSSDLRPGKMSFWNDLIPHLEKSCANINPENDYYNNISQSHSSSANNVKPIESDSGHVYVVLFAVFLSTTVLLLLALAFIVLCRKRDTFILALNTRPAHNNSRTII